MSTPSSVTTAYQIAHDAYQALGVDTEAAMDRLDGIPISLNCWQGDDVRGFENPDQALTGGIAVIGNYPGRARNGAELRADVALAMRMIPGPSRLNLHAIYLESEHPVERDQIRPEHFGAWVDWARDLGIGLDFNPTFFSHPMADSGMTLAHPDPEVRRFWIEHGKACRRVSASFGQALGTPSIMDIWIPDGCKDTPYDRTGPRQRLIQALDDMLAEPIDPRFHRDAVEGKLFGLGAESYTVGSNEFYLAYAASRHLMLCMDAGHFHPTEVVSDKLSAVLPFVDRVLLHVSRPVRWDSDHVVVLDDETQAIANELVRGDSLDQVAIALDFFDASINRIAAWVIGTRAMRKALLRALLEPAKLLAAAEASQDGTARLALFEELKSMPWSAVWDQYCSTRKVPVGLAWLEVVRQYERTQCAGRD
jgi:L-rhamnose isomerase